MFTDFVIFIFDNEGKAIVKNDLNIEVCPLKTQLTKWIGPKRG